MSVSVILALLAVALGGVAIAIQAPINGTLSRGLGDPVLAAAASFAVGLIALAALAIFRSTWPSLAEARSLPWWVWSGGLLGAFYVWAAVWSVGTIGVVSLVAALIFGQLTAALVIDAIGAFGVTQRPIDLTRIAAVALVGAGLVLSRV
jgi:transporter family-2 protein